ncbi:hypothetical protein GWK47_049448 [Chionoecetes opilio]|uniref:Uncharacterized protein n=1 Tax=Chionoecetes opilio TaxID=41210 RepID=A0A8J4YA10_CHIOP|nr:hypothetical protein GWK47_049448 [Chionoecetes opilio]
MAGRAPKTVETVQVIFAESLEVLVMALEALHEEAKPLGLEVYWLKTKVQVFGRLLDETVQSVHACGKDTEILESFTYLGSAVQNDGGSRLGSCICCTDITLLFLWTAALCNTATCFFLRSNRTPERLLAENHAAAVTSRPYPAAHLPGITAHSARPDTPEAIYEEIEDDLRHRLAYQ